MHFEKMRNASRIRHQRKHTEMVIPNLSFHIFYIKKKEKTNTRYGETPCVQKPSIFFMDGLMDGLNRKGCKHEIDRMVD